MENMENVKKVEFAHLAVRSHYSLRQSLIDPAALPAEIALRKQKFAALTDRNALYGLFPFLKAAKEAGIKPIVGAELELREGCVFLLVKNQTGYRTLCGLLSRHHLEQTKLSAEELSERSEGLVLLTGGEGGVLPSLPEEAAIPVLARWKEAFGEDCFIQLGPWAKPHFSRLAQRFDLPLVVAHDASYLHPEERKYWEILRLAHGGKEGRAPRHLAETGELLRAYRDFSGFPEALRNTLRIAERCEFQPAFGLRWPRFPLPPGQAEGMLRRLCEEGLRGRYEHAEQKRARARMEEELSVIRSMGFVDYFLIAWDLVRFARESGIACMPRGSAAGSLVLYLLGVSEVCPLSYHLCFERFLNRERKSPPDIDLDFDCRRRDEVVDYCMRTYNVPLGGTEPNPLDNRNKQKSQVARIATHQCHGPKGALRIAGAGLGLPEETVDSFVRKISKWSRWSLQSAIGRLDPLQEPYTSLVEAALRFEGLPDHLGLHPCGIVVSDRPLSEVAPLEISTKGPLVVQFEMEGTEQAGLLKMDLLGNRNLAILQEAVRLVNRRHGHELVPEKLPLDDRRAFKLLGTGRSYGIYQMESSGVQSLLRQFRPETLEDVTAITSLYRPGPIDGGITPRYVARRHGKEAVSYPDPCLAEVLDHTYGCILYQEQCLQVAAVYAGLSLGEADNLRRGIAKRKQNLLMKSQKLFFEGAERLGRDPAKTEEVWNLLSHFGGYGFVKAHAASCAALAIREAFVKARWPIEYLCAVLSSGMGYYPPRVYLEDARSFGARVLLPSINQSAAHYTVEGKNGLRIGFASIKGLGPSSIEGILRARESGPFQSLLDLRQRTDLTRPEFEALITLGACAEWGPPPALLWQLRTLRKQAQPTLFAIPTAPRFGEDADYSLPMRQAIEQDLLGFVVSAAAMPQEVGGMLFEKVKGLPSRAAASVVAEVVTGRSHTTKQGDRMLFLTLSDGREHLDAVVFPKVYREIKIPKGPALFSGHLNREKGEAVLVISAVEALAQAG